MKTAAALLLLIGTASAQTPATQPASQPASPSAPLPSKPLLGYDFSGRLQDGHRRLRHLLGVYLTPRMPWNASAREGLVKLLERLEYHVHEVREVDRPGGVWLILDMHPHTLVRRVEIKGNWPLFEQNILRRMSMRQGAVLPDLDDPLNRRQALLDQEAARIQQYLMREGFFEAEVRVTAEQRPDDDDAVIRVRLLKGPCYSVGSVKAVGNATLPDGDIVDKVRRFSFFELLRVRLPYVGICPNRFSREDLDDSLAEIEKLYHKRGFPRARAFAPLDASESLGRRRKQVRLRIGLNEQKRIDAFFQGNDSISSTELQSVLTFGEERSYDDVEVENSAEAIRRRYQTKGFYQAVVTWERVRLLSNLERIIFDIQEGPRLPVRRITFEGNKAISSTRLYDVISTRPYENYFSRGGYLTSLQLIQDKEGMVRLYQAEGFPTPKVVPVVSPERDVSTDIGALAAVVTTGHHDNGLWIRWRIDEGPRNVVERVDYRGNRALDDRDLAEDANLQPGGPFVDTFIPADVEQIRKRYAGAGYPYAEVTWAAKPGRSPNSWVVFFEVAEGKPASFGEAMVRGNFRTKTWVVRQALGFTPGDPFTVRRLESAYRGLRATRLFSSVRFDRIGEDSKSDEIHVVVDVQEAHDNRGELQLNGGYSSDQEGAFAGAGYAFRNIFGVGAAFITSGEYGVQKKHAKANLSFPYWLLDRYLLAPVQLDLTGSYLSEKTERFGDLLQYEGRVTLSRRISERLNLAVSGFYRRFRFNDDLVRVAGASEEDEQVGVETTTAAVEPTVIYDARTDLDGNLNPLTPARGYRLTASAAFASQRLGGSDDFIKTSGTAQWYWSPRFLGRVTITHGLRYDQGFPLGDAVLLPEVERFFGGGDTTVRGIEKNHLLVETISNPLYPGPGAPMSYEVVPAGGNIRFLYNLDVQLRITKWFASAVFLDNGVIMNSFAGFRPEKLRHSVGLALPRITTPFAALSIEYAIPIDPGLGDDPRGRFHFNVGFVF